MLFQFLLVLTLLSVSFGQNEYPNYPEEAPKNTPEAYPNPDYGTNPESIPPPNPEQPNPEQPNPQYPDYSYVETVETSTVTTTTTRRTPRSKRPQVFPPTPTSRAARRQSNKIVRWYFLDDQGYPIRAAVRRSYRTGSQNNWIPPYYRNFVTGSRSVRTNGGQPRTQRVEYWWTK